MTQKEVIKIIEKYGIVQAGPDRLRIHQMAKAPEKRAKEMAEIKAAKAEIIAYLQAEAEAKVRAAEERQLKIASIEGLEYLNTLAMAWDEYYSKRQRAFETECVDAYMPKAPAEKMQEANARYPRAAAYRLAESYEMASNYRKSAAGKRAKERIINGDDYEQAIKDMEAEWSAAALESMWD